MRTNIQPYPATKGAMPKFPENGYYGLGRRIQLFAYAYYRLSREEAQKSESTSITNQKKIVEAYCKQHGITILKYFVDDGWSGGNFERPGFQEMMRALESGKANVVITKDLSRLGRDMRESSYYAEQFFPENQIRYIAIADNFDSETENVMAPFQFAMNEVYLRDGSRKIKDVLRMKRQRGEYCACAPYGYMKHPQSKDVLVPNELGVNIVITDDDWYEYLKIFAAFLKQAGYAGMLVLIDELVNIYKIPNAITRQYNYEKILTKYNDAMQGKAQHIGFILCGTPQCMEDPRRGVYSYEALRSRLAEGHFSTEHKDLLSPVIRLLPLTNEEMLILIEKLADIHAGLYEYKQIVTQQDMVDFIEIEFSRIGADTHITPREVIRDFIEVLDIIYQNPGMKVRTLLGSESFTYAQNSVNEETTHAEFAEFDL